MMYCTIPPPVRTIIRVHTILHASNQSLRMNYQIENLYESLYTFIENCAEAHAIKALLQLLPSLSIYIYRQTSAVSVGRLLEATLL